MIMKVLFRLRRRGSVGRREKNSIRYAPSQEPASELGDRVSIT